MVLSRYFMMSFFVFWLFWVFASTHGLSLVVVCGLPTVVASLAAEHGLVMHGFSQQLWHTGLVALRQVESSGPGIELVSPALADRLLTAGLPGKSWYLSI